MPEKQRQEASKFERVSLISIIIISFIGLVFILSLMYNDYDSFFHSPKTSFLISIVLAFVGLAICIGIIYKRFRPIKAFSTLSNLSKVNTMSLFLLCSNLLLFSLQYIIYNQNKSDYVTVSNVYDEINSEINRFEKLSIQYDSLRAEYTNLLGKIESDSIYHFANKSNIIIIDSLELKIKLIAGIKSSGDNQKKKLVSIVDAKINFTNDPLIDREVRKPQSSGSLGVRSPESEMRRLADTTSNISGVLLHKAVNDKILNIGNHIDNIHNIILGIENRGVSFTAFTFRSMESKLGDIYPKSYYVRALFYIQILLSIFIWGYITIVMYRIFDGKE